MKVRVTTVLIKEMEYEFSDFDLNEDSAEEDLVSCIKLDLEDNPEPAIEDAEVTDLTVEKIK